MAGKKIRRGNILFMSRRQVKAKMNLVQGCNHRVNNSFVKMMSNCLPNLNWLSLEQCHVDDDAIDALQKLNLKILNLSHTLITAEGLKILNHSKLHSLDLSNCTRIENALESGPPGLDKVQGYLENFVKILRIIPTPCTVPGANKEV